MHSGRSANYHRSAIGCLGHTALTRCCYVIVDGYSALPEQGNAINQDEFVEANGRKSENDDHRVEPQISRSIGRGRVSGTEGSLRSASLTDQVVGLLSEGLPQLSCEHSHVPIETSSTLVDRAAAGDVLGGAGRLDGPGHTKRSWASDQ